VTNRVKVGRQKWLSEGPKPIRVEMVKEPISGIHRRRVATPPAKPPSQTPELLPYDIRNPKTISFLYRARNPFRRGRYPETASPTTKESWKAREALEAQKALWSSDLCPKKQGSHARPSHKTDLRPKKQGGHARLSQTDRDYARMADVQDVSLGEDGSIQSVVRWRSLLVANRATSSSCHSPRILDVSKKLPSRLY